MKTKNIVVALLIAIVTFLGYKYLSTKQIPTVTSDMKTFVDEKNGFKFMYPKNYSVTSSVASGDGCDTDHDQIVIKDTSGKDLATMSNGVGCPGGAPTTEISNNFLDKSIVKKYVGKDLQNNDSRVFSYHFEAKSGFFTVYVSRGAEETTIDKILSTLTLTK